MAIEALDDKSLHFSYSTPKVTRAVADALILAKSSSASSGKAGKTCTVVACDYVPTLDGSSKCGSINAKTGNKYKCCGNNWDGKNKAPDGNCTWYAWNRAKSAWGSKADSWKWKGAGIWHSNVDASKFEVTRTPKLDNNGNAVQGIAENTRMGMWLGSIM